MNYVLHQLSTTKKNILLVSTLLLSGHVLIQADNDTSKPDSQVAHNKISKATATKETIELQPGNTLDLSEFTTMHSGIKYKVIKKGSGSKPVHGETVVVHYDGYLLVNSNKVGYKFDSSLDRNTPFSFRLGSRQVIPGWETTLADMKVGETRIVILPSKEAYGSRATSKIPADSSLIFKITLIKAS